MALHRVTTVEGYVPNRKKYQGHGYVTLNDLSRHRIAHQESSCYKASVDFMLVPVFERDGKLYASHRGEEVKVSWCTVCPETEPLTWRERGACFEQPTPSPFVEDGETDLFVELYCSQCPVVEPCLDYAISIEDNSPGVVWGGIVPPWDKRKRSAQFRKEKRRLAP